MKRIYFDNAATTPLDAEVLVVMNDILKNHFGNPSSVHAPGREARTIIEESRKTVSKLLNCSPGELFFTSCGTESDNMAIRKSVDDLGVKNIITSKIEHHAVLHTIDELGKQGRIQKHFVNLFADGQVDHDQLEKLLKENTKVLVSLMHVNNEIGNLLNLERVGGLCKKYHALFHSDTVQSIGNFPIDLQKINVDFICGSAHKFNGPKGTGFIYIRSKNKISPFITGGAQERNMRAGTENTAGIAGLAKAMEISYRDLEENKKHCSELKSYLKSKLEEKIHGINFNGDTGENSSYKILNVLFPATPVAEMFLYKLDMEGIAVSGGSACASGSNIGSHVLTALCADPSRPAVRFSFGKQNTVEEVDFVVEKIVEMFKV
ncbi:MAG: cysteine desulfurase family protein [Bacteroidia bacterium]